jgi:hypothetical protein
MRKRLVEAAMFGAATMVLMAVMLWLWDPSSWTIAGFAGGAAFNSARVASEPR